jgi:hypothetical protein
MQKHSTGPGRRNPTSHSLFRLEEAVQARRRHILAERQGRLGKIYPHEVPRRVGSLNVPHGCQLLHSELHYFDTKVSAGTAAVSTLRDPYAKTEHDPESLPHTLAIQQHPWERSICLDRIRALKYLRTACGDRIQDEALRQHRWA